MNFFPGIFIAPEFGFLRRALLFGLLAAPALGIVGTLVVTRRIASLAGASAHAALGGMGIALFLARVCGISAATPMLGAICGAVGAALIVGIVTLHGKEREDTVIGVVWALGMSVGLIFLDRTPGYVDWQGYLFGNILLLSKTDLMSMALLDAVLIPPAVLGYRKILALSFDPDFAAIRGIKVEAYYLTILALTALTIVLLINLVGIILVIALLTLPAATAGCFTRRLKSMMFAAALLAALFVAGGIAGSVALLLPTGPVIVVAAGIIYLAALAVRRFARR
ncbi:MAG: metal ABC transporter permease [Victivallaceae bacterium]|nr:metal ABC transporter permease [Victivallaceae bacterium]